MNNVAGQPSQADIGAGQSSRAGLQPSRCSSVELIHAYASAGSFAVGTSVVPATPWNRPFRVQDIEVLDFETPLSAETLTTSSSLAVHRLLLNIYEQSMLFLPQRRLAAGDVSQLNEFFSPELVAMGERLRPQLEHVAFSYLDSRVATTGNWDVETLESYVLSVIDAHEREPSSLVAQLARAADPEAAARYLLAQMAPDFLSEASAMARATLGNFGPGQSELVKVLIDEYGYGVHEKKHSTLFEECLRSVGMSADVHAYYFHYLPSSLALVNYFHYICSRKARYFRYLGALYFTEASIPHFNQELSRFLREVFGERVNTQYFDEHVHIDKHHRRMVLDKLIKPSVELYGPEIIPEVLNGFESFAHLQELADKDVLEQISFAESLGARSAEGGGRARAGCSGVRFREVEGELSYSHIHDATELFTVKEGELEFFAGLTPITLRAGEEVVIPGGRLHGTKVTSRECEYVATTIHKREASRS